MKKIIILLVVCNSVILAQAQCDTTMVDFDKVIEKYMDEFKKIEQEGESINDEASNPNPGEAAIGIDIDLKWNNKKFSMDLVSVTMKNKKIVLNTPQATMKNKTISFKKPEVVMVPKKTGQYPVITCRGLSCTTRWKDIITNVPETRMKEYKVITAVPEFKYATTSFITKTPEIKKSRKEIILKIPEITLKNLKVEAKQMEDEAKALEANAKNVADRQKEESLAVLSQKFACYRNDISVSRAAAAASFESSISEINNSIEELKRLGADPGNIINDDGANMNLFMIRDELYANFEATKKAFDEALASLDKSEKESIESISGS